MGIRPNLDPIDLELLVLLQKDARRTNKDLAEAVGIAQSTCHDRIRNLREQRVIRGCHADVDPEAVGRPIKALINVRLQPKTTTSVRDFQQGVFGAPGTLAISMVSGADDFIVEIAVPSIESVRNFLLEHITSRDDVVDARTAIVYEQVRRPYMAPI